MRHYILFLLIFTISILAANTNDFIDQDEPPEQTDRVDRTWSGVYNTDWGDGRNWVGGVVPGAADNVLINTGAVRYPVVSSTRYCNQITMQTGTSLEIQMATLNVTTRLTTAGNLIMSNASAILNLGTDLIFNSGAALTINTDGPEIIIADDLQFNSGSNIVTGYGLFWLTGGGASITTYSPVVLRHLKISGEYCHHYVSSTASLTVKGNFEIVSGTTYDGNANVVTYIHGDLIAGSNAIVQFNSGVVQFRGYSNNTITMSSISYFSNVVIEKDAGYNMQLNSDIDINGNLTIASGTLSASVYNIYLTGHWNNIVGTTGFDEGYGGPASVVFDGSMIQQLISYSEDFNNLVLNNDGGFLAVVGGTSVNCRTYQWVNGSLSIFGNFTAEDIVNSSIAGNFYVYLGATVNLYQDTSSSVAITGHMNLANGVVNIHGGQNALCHPGGTISLFNDGILDYKDVNLTIYTGFNANINGGTLRVAKSLTIYSTGFNQAGGTIEMYGDFFGWIYADDNAQLYNLTINKSTNTYQTLTSNININGDLNIQAGKFSIATHTVHLAGSFYNPNGAENFIQGTGTVVFVGTSLSMIENSVNINVLKLNKTDIGSLTIPNYVNVVCNSYEWISGNFNHFGNFTAFDLVNNSVPGDMYVYLGATVNLYQDTSSSVAITGHLNIANGVVNVFGGQDYNYLTTGGTLSLFNNGVLDYKNANVTINTGFNVNYEGGTLKVAKSLEIYKSDFYQSGGTIELYGEYDTYFYITSSAHVHHVHINKADNYYLVLSNSDSSIYGNLTITRGNFISSQSKYVYGDVSVYGKMTVQGNLYLAQNKIFNILSGGSVMFYGSETNQISVSRIPAHTGYYTFTVDDGGTIGAFYTLFEYMNANGINLQSGSMVDNAYSFHNCSFRNGASGGKLLTISNGQDLLMHGVSFPANIWGGSFNVSKTVNQGSVTFSLYSGSFAGETYEQDTFGRIHWSQTSLPPVQNLNISYNHDSGQVHLQWDYQTGFAQFNIYHSANAQGPYELLETTYNKYADYPPTDRKFYKVTAVMTP